MFKSFLFSTMIVLTFASNAFAQDKSLTLPTRHETVFMDGIGANTLASLYREGWEDYAMSADETAYLLRHYEIQGSYWCVRQDDFSWRCTDANLTRIAGR